MNGRSSVPGSDEVNSTTSRRRVTVGVRRSGRRCASPRAVDACRSSSESSIASARTPHEVNAERAHERRRMIASGVLTMPTLATAGSSDRQSDARTMIETTTPRTRPAYPQVELGEAVTAGGREHGRAARAPTRRRPCSPTSARIGRRRLLTSVADHSLDQDDSGCSHIATR